MLQNGSWAALGALLGRSWGLPGLLGGSWSLLGRSLGALGAFLGARGAVLGRSLDVLERSWGSFWAPGALLLELFWSPLRAGLQYHENIENHWFFKCFSRFFRFRGSQNRSKIVPKSLRRGSWTPGWPQEGAKSDLGGSGNALEGFREAWKASWEANKADNFPGPRLRWARDGPPGRGRGGVVTLRRRLY